jgi:hypothetical protein
VAVTDWAVIDNGDVINVIVVDDPAWVTSYEHDTGLTLVEIDSLDPKPGIGWTYASGTFSPPPAPPTPPSPPKPTIAAEPTSIAGDGTTSSTVTLTWPTGTDAPAAPSAVLFNVNGQLTSATMTNGEASITVTSTTPSSTVTVSSNGVSAQIEVT